MGQIRQLAPQFIQIQSHVRGRPAAVGGVIFDLGNPGIIERPGDRLIDAGVLMTGVAEREIRGQGKGIDLGANLRERGNFRGPGGSQ